MRDNDDLKNTLEKIRLENFPELPAELIAEILEIELRTKSKREEAYKQIDEIMEKYLKKGGL